MRLSKAFRTWWPSARNPTNGTRSNSTERTSNVASNGIIFWPLKCVRVEDLMGSGVPTIGGISEKTSGVLSVLWQWIYFSNDVLIVRLWTDIIWGYVIDEVVQQAPNDTAYKRWSCHNGHKLLCKLCRNQTPPPPPAMGARHTVFGKPAMRMVGAAPHKSGWCRDESRSDNSNKQVCVCDICYKQIHVRKQISIMCNRIQHWVHLRSSGVRQAQYTDTRTCHLHR